MHYLRLRFLTRAFLVESSINGSNLCKPRHNQFYGQKMSKRFNQVERTVMNSRRPPDGIYVQVLPVVVPDSIAKANQPDSIKSSLENLESECKLLLCKWSSGDFKDRYTGLINSLARPEYETVLRHQEKRRSEEKYDLLHQFAKDLIPCPLKNQVQEIRLVGLLRFHDPPVYDEYIYLANLIAPDSSNGQNDCDKRTSFFEEEIRFGDNSCYWFSWDKIPFREMPADDELWYPKVLQQQEMVQGSFTFGGWSEKTIKSFELQIVQQIE